LATWTGNAAAQAAEPVSYVEILHQLTDLDRLTRLQTGCTAGICSSWDRNSKTVWGANGDAGQYLRVESDGEAVMMDSDGPGVIYRTWSANPMGKLRIYLDGAQAPRYEWTFRTCSTATCHPSSSRWCTAATKPSRLPTAICLSVCQAYQDHRRQGARPVLPFQLRPVPQRSAGVQLSLAVDRRGTSRFVRRRGRLVAAGARSEAAAAGQQTISKTITVAPGQTVELCALATTGTIRPSAPESSRSSATRGASWSCGAMG